MKNKTKYADVNLINVMEQIVNGHTTHYKSDFEYDIKTLREAATKAERSERTFVWLCRECGTWILNEKNVFIQESHEYSVFTYYAEQTRDTVLSFVVEVTGVDGGTVKGNIYAHDYPAYYQHVKKSAVSAGNIIVAYEKGERILPPTAHFGAYPDCELGKFVSYQFVPESQEQLEMVLYSERQNRECFKEVIAAESR